MFTVHRTNSNNNNKIFLVMASASESGNINILSWNIRGLKAKMMDERKDRLLNIFGRYDVVLLQETHIGKKDPKNGHDDDADWNCITKVLNKKEFQPTLQKLPNQRYTERKDDQPQTMYMTYFSSKSQGVAILINKPHKLLTAFCEDGEYAWVHVKIGNQKYTFVSVYYSITAPDLICDLMLKLFFSFLTNASDAFKSKLVIGGDFNTTLNPALDATKIISGHSARSEKLKNFMTMVKLSDVWRKKNNGRREYTRIHPQRKISRLFMDPTQSRLDYFFMLENDVFYVENCDIINDLGENLSDHFPVSLTLNMNRTNGIFGSEE